MSDDFDGGDNSIDTAFDDVSLDTGTSDTSFDVDSIMDSEGDDFSQFEAPVENDLNSIPEFDDSILSTPTDGELETLQIPEGINEDTTDGVLDVNDVMDAGQDDFEQFENPVETVEVVEQPSADVTLDISSADTDEPIEVLTDAEPVETIEDVEQPSVDVTPDVFLADADESVEVLTDTGPVETTEVAEQPGADVTPDILPTDTDEPIEVLADAEPVETTEVAEQSNMDVTPDIHPADADELVEVPTDAKPVEIAEIVGQPDADVTPDILSADTDEPIEVLTDAEPVETAEDIEQPDADVAPDVLSTDTDEPIEVLTETEPVETAEVAEQPNADVTPDVSPADEDELFEVPTDTEPVETVEVAEQPDADVTPDVSPADLDEPIEVLTDTEPVEITEVAEQVEMVDTPEKTPERIYDDFEQTFLSERPDFQETYEAGSFYEQGINEFGYQGTCGPTSQANALNKILGTNEFTENKILSVALENDLCNTYGSPDACGGTTTNQFMELYDTVNEQIGGKIETELFENDNALSVEEMAGRIDDGAVLNVAVDADALWGRPRDYTDAAGGYNPDFYSDHWITVTGCQRDEMGNIQGFDVIDSGGGVDYVSAEQCQEMCFGTEEHRVLDPTCIVVSKKEMASDVPFHPPDSQQVKQPSWVQRIFGKRGDS